jgi:hypothetical protein
MLDEIVDPSASPCEWCGAPRHLEVFEVFGARDFLLDGCCEMSVNQAHDLLRDPERGAALLRSLEIETICGHSLRRVVDDDCGSLVLDWQPRIVAVSQSRAKAFVRAHHEHAPNPPAGWRFGAGIFNGPAVAGYDDALIGVVMVGRPVSRMYDPTTVAEVSRLCLRFDVPDALRWNACSMAYAWAAREAFRRGFRRIQTYTLASESGASLMAAGWTCEGQAGGGHWDRPGRPRGRQTPHERKVRWSRSARSATRDGRRQSTSTLTNTQLGLFSAA